jgi:hypothetical protein
MVVCGRNAPIIIFNKQRVDTDSVARTLTDGEKQHARSEAKSTLHSNYCSCF